MERDLRSMRCFSARGLRTERDLRSMRRRDAQSTRTERNSRSARRFSVQSARTERDLRSARRFTARGPRTERDLRSMRCFSARDLRMERNSRSARRFSVQSARTERYFRSMRQRDSFVNDVWNRKRAPKATFSSACEKRCHLPAMRAHLFGICLKLVRPLLACCWDAFATVRPWTSHSHITPRLRSCAPLVGTTTSSCAQPEPCRARPSASRGRRSTGSSTPSRHSSASRLPAHPVGPSAPADKGDCATRVSSSA